MSSEVVRTITNRVRRFVDGSGEDEGPPPPPSPRASSSKVDPVVAATDRRIKQRGLSDLRDIVEQMSIDPSYAPDPIDVLEAGIPAQDLKWDVIDDSSASELHEM